MSDDFFGDEAAESEVTEQVTESAEVAETPEATETDEAAETAEGAEDSPTEGEEPSPEEDYKAKFEAVNKQYEDTRNYATRVNQELTDIKRGQDVIQQKLDGTYVEPTDPAPQEVAQLERVKTSMAAAIDKHGSKEIFDKIEREGSPVRELIQSDPRAAARIMSAPLPYVEAMNVLAERETLSQYGGNSVTEVIENVKKSERESLREELTASITKEIMEKLDKADSQTGSLRDVNAGPATQTTTTDADFFAPEY